MASNAAIGPTCQCSYGQIHVAPAPAPDLPLARHPQSCSRLGSSGLPVKSPKRRGLFRIRIADDDPTFAVRGRIKGLRRLVQTRGARRSVPVVRQRGHRPGRIRPPVAPSRRERRAPGPRSPRPPAAPPPGPARPAPPPSARPAAPARTRPRPATRQLRSGCTAMSRKWSSESTPPAQRAAGSSRFTYQFLNRQPVLPEQPHRPGLPRPGQLQHARCRTSGRSGPCAAWCSGWPAAPGAPGVPSASTGLTHTCRAPSRPRAARRRRVRRSRDGRCGRARAPFAR